MAQIIKFDLSKEEYLELAVKTFADGDAEKSIIYLTKALHIDEHFTEASLLLAQIYSTLGATEISNAVLFDALGLHPDGENEDRVLYSLAMNYLDLGQPDVAEYYLRDFDGEFEFGIPSEEPINERRGSFRVVYPRDDDYYEMLIEKAYSLVRERKFDEAIALLSEVDPKSKSADAANHVVLVCLMMKNDLDSVIENALKMLKINDSLAVRCTLATAYMMEERLSDAYATVEDILKTDYTRVEDILLLLPLLVNLEVHPQVVKYTKRVLDNLQLQPNTMIWLSQGLYNLGQRDEARKVMLKVRNIYGKYSPAQYFLDLYATNPDSVGYSMSLPHIEKLTRYKALEEYLKLGTVDFSRALISDPALRSLIEWAFDDDNEKLEFILVSKLDSVKSAWVKEFYRKQLISSDLSFELMARLLTSLLDNGYVLDVDVVAQDRFKEVSVCLPDAYYKLPRILRDAVGYSVCDIIFTDEEPNLYLDRLRVIVNDIVSLDEDGKVRFANTSAERVSLFRSMRTLVGVLLAMVYCDEDDIKKETIERYGLNVRTFDKYYDLLFGGGNGRKKE